MTTMTSIIALTTRLSQNVTREVSIKLQTSISFQVGEKIELSGINGHEGPWRVAEVVTEGDGSFVYKCRPVEKAGKRKGKRR